MPWLFLECSQLKPQYWDLDGAMINGFLGNFGAQIIEISQFGAPEGYSLEAISKIERKYEKLITNNDAERMPNIIIIMDESFSDLSVLGSEIKTAQEITPFVNSLHENTIKGYALSSVFGGGTEKSEYECLTGNSAALFGTNMVIYNLYIHEPIYSMASYLHKYNYYCEATHPYFGSGWSRTTVYPLLGFDKMTFIDDYPQKNLVRDFVSDQEMFEYVIHEYEARDSSKPWFLFGVTMQNHGSYSYSGPNYSPSIELRGYEQSYDDVEQYLGLINETDKAVEILINYFSNQEEPVLILFFGDHLPNLNHDFYREVHGGEFNTLAEKELQYKVPFFIWANYDINEELSN